jgi:intracellular sulfur oxidation DsrE/DsrF family protein
MISMRSYSGKALATVAFGLAFAAPLFVTLALTDAGSAISKQWAPETKPAAVKAHRLVLQINTDDPTVMRALISTSLNLPKYYRETKQEFSIEIVAYNAGIHMFRVDTSPVKELLKVVQALTPDVRFVVCEATKLGMERSEGHPISFIDNVQMVPSGPGRIIELQEAGWSYIRS